MKKLFLIFLATLLFASNTNQVQAHIGHVIGTWGQGAYTLLSTQGGLTLLGCITASCIGTWVASQGCDNKKDKRNIGLKLGSTILLASILLGTPLTVGMMRQ